MEAPIVPETASETARMPQLAIKPYAAQVLTDHERGKHFVTLIYRHKKSGPRDTQTALIGRVIDDLTQAGLVVTDAVEIHLYPDKPRDVLQTDKTRYSCRVAVPVRLLGDEQQRRKDWVEVVTATSADN